MTVQTVNTAAALDATDRLLARGVLFRALKLGLDRPGEATCRALFGKEGRETLSRAARSLDEGVPGPLGAAVDRLCSLAEPGLDELQLAHERLFGHTLRGRVCPYECEYGHRALLQQAQELADLSGYYAAFGLRASETRHERPDHIACQFEFLEFLVRKECWALAHADAEMAEVTRSAARLFLGDHLARFGRAFARSLQKASPDDLYGSLGALCEALLRVECERLDLELGPQVLELRSTEPDGVPMACGSGDDQLVQLGSAERGGPPGAEPGEPK
ncbi:MAG: molecular chaperone [Thermoanaerobaculia bacterium]